MSARRFCRLLGGAGLALFIALAFTPLSNALSARWSEPARPPDVTASAAGAIVVLGAGSAPDGLLDDTSVRRALQGIRLWRRGRAPLLVLLGPAGWYRAPTESSGRAALARDLGVPDQAMLLGYRARTTREEAQESAALLSPRGIRRIVLVTGTLHMPRARRLFEREGFDVVAAAVDEVSPQAAKPEARLDLARRLLQEALARLVYRAAGAL